MEPLAGAGALKSASQAGWRMKLRGRDGQDLDAFLSQLTCNRLFRRPVFQPRHQIQELLAVPGLRKDGARLSLEFNIVLIKTDDAQILGSAAIIRDVTPRWEKDQELRKRLARLEARLSGGEEPQP